jgi:hypothetical protein
MKTRALNNVPVKTFSILLLGILIGVGVTHYAGIISLGKGFLQRVILPSVSSGFSLVEIPCTYDTAIQKAYFYGTTSKVKMPLVVSLHPWSSDYRYIENPTSLANFFKNEDWNFIYPDFRGVNDTPEGCMSEAAIRDIDDAIDYAIRNGNVDENRIAVVGHSGGGMAALGVYLRSRYYIRYTMAWCPIADLESWYYQSKYDDTVYWKHILQATISDQGLNTEEARIRSPLFMNSNQQSKDYGEIEIYAGINDGYTGTVSIFHSLSFYNKLVIDIDLSNGGGGGAS